MRDIKYIVIHCTDTLPTAEIEAIQRYWKEKLQWNSPGYHYIIKQDGEVVQLLDENKISNGVLGYNKHCINVCYIGGKTKEGKHKDTRTRAQQHAMFDTIIELIERYPKAKIKGHCEFPNQGGRTCPNFDVSKWLEDYTPDVDFSA
ncbi:MAG: N-acetylmuramoyl-L-alanine amidase [Bacteroidota bacterium]